MHWRVDGTSPIEKGISYCIARERDPTWTAYFNKIEIELAHPIYKVVLNGPIEQGEVLCHYI
jgi:hypothetical protein